VRARLANRARATKRPFNELLQYYAMERFLYRLSRSEHRSRFVLKGALMLRVWDAPLARPTKDVDFLGRLNNSIPNLVAVVRDILAVDVEPDGMAFDGSTIKAESIKEEAEYEGVRIRFTVFLGKARVSMQVDIGFGDVVVPEVKEINYPVLLDFPPPQLQGYPREAVVAEKFQAMVFLGSLNTRMKDFYDIWLLARNFDFQGPTLREAIQATFANRGSEIQHTPVALAPIFTGAQSTRAQWKAFVGKVGTAIVPQDFAEVAAAIAQFLLPVAKACSENQDFNLYWPASGPWRLP